jgi:hypothetical protein
MSKKLSAEAQIFIVQKLACFWTPSEIAEAVKDEFGTEIKRQNVRLYNPEQNPEVAKHWKELFDETRKRLLEDITTIPIASQNYRLAELNKLYHQAGRNIMLRKDILEQAAKEMGGSFTNRQKQDVSVKGEVTHMTLEEWKQRGDERRRQAEEALRAAEEDQDQPAQGDGVEGA